MPRRIKWLRMGKWTGLVIVALTVTAWLVNLRWSAYGLTGSSPPMWQVMFVSGVVTVGHYDTPPPGALVRNSRGPVGFQIAAAPKIGLHWRMSRSDTTNTASGVRIRILALPLWVLALLAGTSAALFWRLDPPPAGRCRNCNYDLIGNTTGICPECGKERPAEQRMQQSSK